VISLIEWCCRVIEAIALMTAGVLLMYWRMGRRLDSAVAAARHSGAVTLTEQGRRHESAFNQLARDYNNIRDDQQRAVVVCERLAGDIAQLTTENDALTTENDALRYRIARTTGAINAWGPKTERGQA
jgi:methyl-accepting chemotaxis protein